MSTPEQLAKRYPWSQFKDVNPDPYAPNDVRHAFAVEHWVARITWIVPSSNRLDYGWRYETRTFDSVDKALEIAAQPMGVAKSVHVDKFNWGGGPQSPRAGG